MESVKAASRRPKPRPCTNTCRARQILAVVVVAATAACPTETPTAAAPDCRLVMRLPKNRRVMRIEPPGEGPPRAVAAGLPPCPASVCLVGSRDARLSVHTGGIHVVFGGQTFDLPHGPPSPLRAAGTAPGVAIGTGVIVVNRGDTWEAIFKDGTRRSVPAPVLPARVEVGRPSVVDDGVILRVTERGREQPPLLLIPPSTKPPSPGLEPIPDTAGRLRAWLERGDGAITLVMPDGTRRPIEVAGPVGRATATDVAVVLPQKGAIIAFHDGSELRTTPKTTVILRNQEMLLLDLDRRTLSVARNGHDVEVKLVFPAGVDLAGKPLPPGASVLRESTAHDDNGVVLHERLQLANCKVEDRLHWLDLARSSVTPIAAGDDKMRMHVTHAAGSFYFVEADAEYTSE